MLGAFAVGGGLMCLADEIGGGAGTAVGVLGLVVMLYGVYVVKAHGTSGAV